MFTSVSLATLVLVSISAPSMLSKLFASIFGVHCGSDRAGGRGGSAFCTLAKPYTPTGLPLLN